MHEPIQLLLLKLFCGCWMLYYCYITYITAEPAFNCYILEDINIILFFSGLSMEETDYSSVLAFSKFYLSDV